MRKRIKILHCITFGIFPGSLSFSNGFDVNELLKIYGKYNDKGWYSAFKSNEDFFRHSNYCASKITYKEKLYFFIYIKEPFKFTDYEFIKLAHEVLHICQYYLVDVLHRDFEHEAEAYFHSHIMSECLKVLRGKK